MGLLQPRREELLVSIPDDAMPSSFILGRLLEADGSPVPEEWVSLMHETSAAGRFSVERASGAFEIGPLSSGNYWLEMGRVVWNGTPPTRLGPYRVGSRETLDLGDVRLSEPGSVNLSILRSDEVWTIPTIELFPIDEYY